MGQVQQLQTYTDIQFFLVLVWELNPEVCSTISDTLYFMTELQVNIQMHFDSSLKSVEIQRT